MEWKDLVREEPKYKGPYLCEVVQVESSGLWYEVVFWEEQDEYRTVYSNEFKQKVRIKEKSNGIGFPDDEDWFVSRWMEIPGHNYQGIRGYNDKPFI